MKSINELDRSNTNSSINKLKLDIVYYIKYLFKNLTTKEKIQATKLKKQYLQ